MAGKFRVFCQEMDLLACLSSSHLVAPGHTLLQRSRGMEEKRQKLAFL
jgi:hypothetical protein